MGRRGNRGGEAARRRRRFTAKAGERHLQDPGEVLELGRQSDRPAALRLRSFTVDSIEEEPEVVPPSEYFLRGPLALHGRLELGTAARDEILREVAGPLHPDPIAVQAPVVVPAGRLRERSLHLGSLGQEPLHFSCSRPGSQAAQLPHQPPEPPLFFPGRGAVGPGYGNRRFPADLERGRGILREKPEPSDPGQKRAIHFALAIRRKAPHDGDGPALNLPPSERARGRGRSPQCHAEVMEPLGVTLAPALARTGQGTPAKLPERG